MEKIEKIAENSPTVSDVKKFVEYEKQDSKYREFNPQYKVQEENLNINPLSARSCKCYPCRCK